MPFAYYRRLSKAGKATYARSDALPMPQLTRPEALAATVQALAAGLTADDRRRVASAASELTAAVVRDLGAIAVKVKVLSVRPRRSGAEYHGLYEWTDGEVPVITVWMRTAAKGQVVAFKSFLRTLLHEVCHHLDYAKWKLKDSYHTEGFFKREAALARQLLATLDQADDDASTEATTVKRATVKQAARRPPSKEPSPQLALPFPTP